MISPGGLAATLFVSSFDFSLPDPYINYVALLLHGDARNGAQGYASFVDASGNNNTPTRGGLAGQGITVPSAAFPGSMVATTSGDYLSTSAIQLGGSDFTLETWFYETGTSGSAQASFFSQGTTEQAANSFNVFAGSNRLIMLYSGTSFVTASTAYELNTWNHLAVVRSGTTWTIYLNGTNVGSGTATRTFTATTFMLNQGYGNNVGGIIGYFAETRIVVGTAVYTSDFTVPVGSLTAVTNTAWLLHYDNAKVIDSKRLFSPVPTGVEAINTSVYSYGTGSIYFNGATMYTVPYSTTYMWDWAALGSYTVECWVNPAALGTSIYPICSKSNSTAYNSWELVFNASSQLELRYWIGTPRTVIDTGTPISLNTWSHIAFTFDGTNIRLFVNGQLRITQAYVATLSNGATQLNIGGTGGGISGGSMAYFNGYMDEFRITQGVCRYRTDFTIPTVDHYVPTQPSTALVAPVADFTNSPNGGTVPLTVSFTDASSSWPSSWAWTFGDGSTSSAQNPSYTYNTAGTFDISLTASNAFGSSSKTAVGRIITGLATDSYYNYTQMLISGDTRSGATGYVNFTDSSGNGYTPTRGGLAGQAGKGPNSAFAGTLNVAANTDYLSTTSIALGSSNFSMETWINVTTATTSAIFSSATSELGTASFILYYTSTGNLILYSGSTQITAAVSLTLGAWYHVALTRVGNVFTIYLNGSNVGSVTVARTFTGTTVQLNRGYGGIVVGVIGFYANTRVVVGSSAYSGNFTKPTAPVTAITNTKWLLNYANALVVDSSSKGWGLVPTGTESISTSVYKYGSGSVYFNGATMYTAPAPTTTTWNWATPGAYTIEGWFYPTSLGGSVRPIVSQSNGTVTNQWEFVFTTTSQLEFRYWTGAARTVIDVGATVPVNQWSFIALTFDGANIRIFVNGVLKVTTAYIATQASGTTQLNIGGSGGGLEGGSMVYYAGYMDDFRMTSGVCRYSSTFTPPTAAFAPR